MTLFWPDYSARAIPSMRYIYIYIYMRVHGSYACIARVHELLHVDARHLWLTRQENRGKRSQNHDAKLTRPFLRVGRGWLARLLPVNLIEIMKFFLFQSNYQSTARNFNDEETSRLCGGSTTYLLSRRYDHG